MAAGNLDKMTTGLSGAAFDVMWCLFLHGPTWDWNLPSKQGRDELVHLGYAGRTNGWNYLHGAGVEYAIDRLCMDERKDLHERKQRGK